MKKWTAVILMLVFLTATAFAAPVYELDGEDQRIVRADFDNNGTKETLEFYTMPITNSGTVPVIMYMTKEDNTLLGDAPVFEYFPGEEGFELRGSVYLTEINGGIGILTQFRQENYEMPVSVWALFEVVDGELVTEKMICDPGYTSGAELRVKADPYSEEYAPVYTSDSYDKDEYLSALNAAFDQWGIRFAFEERAFDDFCYGATVCDEADRIKVLDFTEKGLEIYEGDVDESLLKYYVYTTANVNVRSEADKDSEIVTVLFKGATADYLYDSVTDKRGVTWYKVKVNDKEGWVSGKYSQLLSDGQTESGAYDDSGIAAGEGTLKGHSEIVVIGNSINVRALPDISDKSIGMMYKGETAKLMGGTSVDQRGIEWYQIDFHGNEGWVSAKYAKLR